MKPSVRLLLAFAFVSAIGTANAAPGDCDRDCLRGFITRYLDAMVAHNPGALAVGDNVKFTEDTVRMSLGEGLWKNALRVRAYRQDILDVRQGVAASQVVVEEGWSPVMLALRPKVASQKITEVETQVTRTQKEGAIFNINALQTPGKAMSLPLNASQRATREDAIQDRRTLPGWPKSGQLRCGGRALRARCSIASRTARSLREWAARGRAAKI